MFIHHRKVKPLSIVTSLGLVLCLALAPGCSDRSFLNPTVPTPTPNPATEKSPESTAVAAQTTPGSTGTSTGTLAEISPASSLAATDTVAAPTETPLDTLTPTMLPSPTNTITPTATATLTPTVSIVITEEPDCESPGVQIAGWIVQERTIEFTGTASIGNFSYYKFEYKGTEEEGWHFIGRSETAVQDDTLYVWDTSPLATGMYQVHLMTVDDTGNYPPPCEIEVEILE